VGWQWAFTLAGLLPLLAAGVAYLQTEPPR
jgi:hypothetical protein